MYQRIKDYIETLIGKLMANEVLERPCTHLMVNFITKLLLVAEKNAILVVYNKLFKMAYFVTITKRMSAKRLIRLFRGNLWKLHRLLESVISDRRL